MNKAELIDKVAQLWLEDCFTPRSGVRNDGAQPKTKGGGGGKAGWRRHPALPPPPPPPSLLARPVIASPDDHRDEATFWLFERKNS